MAKRSAPVKKCINKKCGEMMHARKLTCPKCGTPNPVKEKAPRPVIATVEDEEDTYTPNYLVIEAVRFARVCGGIQRGIDLLEELLKLPK